MTNGTNYTTRTLAVIVLPEDESIFCESATTIRIEDESGGEFVVIEQHPDNRDAQQIAINPEEWPMVRAAIDDMVAKCKGETE